MNIEKTLIMPDRIRKIEGSFAFIPHRFLTEGFLASISQYEILVYFLLVLASDRQGLSYYSQDRLCTLLKMTIDDFMTARNNLIERDLIAFDGFFFQTLSLPPEPVQLIKKPLSTPEDFRQRDPLTIRKIIDRALSDDGKGGQ